MLATTDELTQLPNRRMFAEQLDARARARAPRRARALPLLCLDLDRFKDVNDSLGHGYGDRMLVEVAGRCARRARETDVVARVGGDEFVILLADLDAAGGARARAAAVAARIRERARDPIEIDAVELRADACIGVAIYPTDSRDAEGLLAAADAAMYAGKTRVPARRLSSGSRRLRLRRCPRATRFIGPRGGCSRSSGSGSRSSRRTRAPRRPVSRRASTAACSSRSRRSARTSCSGSRAASSSAATCG